MISTKTNPMNGLCRGLDLCSCYTCAGFDNFFLGCRFPPNLGHISVFGIVKSIQL